MLIGCVWEWRKEHKEGEKRQKKRRLFTKTKSSHSSLKKKRGKKEKIPTLNVQINSNRERKIVNNKITLGLFHLFIYLFI